MLMPAPLLAAHWKSVSPESTEAKVREAIEKLESAKVAIKDAVHLYLDDALDDIQEADELLSAHEYHSDPNFAESRIWIGNIDTDEAIKSIDWMIDHVRKFYR